jgi:NAD(P)-dependent dehydrogenase (short-subunit alcohol dehydrogenase family)
MSKFDGRNVIVTGAASGVGQHIALEFAKEGANILIADLHVPDKTLELIREAGGSAEYVQCNLSHEADVVHMAWTAGDVFGGKIDVLVNNAGFNGKTQLVKDMNLNDWNFTLGINLTGTMLVTREIIPYMMQQNQGKIVNIASNVAKRGLPLRADYVASKWALLGLTQTLALELVDYNIRVNAVCPGPVEVDTISQLLERHANSEGKTLEQVRQEWESVPMKRFIKPEEVANVVKFLAGDASSAMTGQAINVTGGFIMS